MLELDNVDYRFATDSGLVVKGVSLAVRPGERVCLVGGNGSGKSTVARLACGDLVPVAGSVRIDGNPCTEAGCGDAIALVCQDAREMATSLLVEEEVAFSPRCQLLAPDEIERRVRDALEACGITHLRTRALDELSGGQMQLVALASALAARPQYILLDEACAHLDEQGRQRIAQVIEGLRQQGIGILQITHDPREVAGATRVVALEAGQVVWEGTPDKWLANQAKEAERERAACENAIGDLDFLAPRERAGLHLVQGTASYGKACVFKDLTVDVLPGELVMLCGPSGAGKSTLARVLAGVHKLDEGEVLLGSERVKPGHVGLAFQRPEDQLFASSVWDDVAYGPQNLGMDEQQVKERVEKALIAFGVPRELWHRHAQELSGGMRRRVALASIVSPAPGAYVLDEPTAGLDVQARLLLHAVVARLRKAGCPVLLVTHDPQEWADEATRTMTLEAPSDVQQHDAAHGAEILRGAAVHERSRLSAIDARVRVLAALCLTVTLFCCQSIPQLLVIAGVVAIAAAMGGHTVRSAASALLPALPLLLAVVVANALRLDATGDVTVAGALGLSTSGAQLGVMAALRILCLVELAVTLASDISSTDVTKVVAMTLAPLERLGVPVSDVALTLSITLTLIPQSYREFQRIECAQRARGAHFDNGSIVARLRAWAAVMVPLVVVLFERADALAHAMRLRGYRGKMTQVSSRLTVRDGIALLAVVALCGLLLCAWPHR